MFDFEKDDMFDIKVDLKDSKWQRRDTLASIDSGIGADFDDFEDDLAIDAETGLEVISLEEVAEHYSPEDGWMVLYDRVYHVSRLLRSHPGGEEVMMEYLGQDATMAFRGVGHSKAALRMLQPSLLGILPTEERLNFTY